MFESILAALKQSLPYYEREDKDDYFYIATSVDLAGAAKIISDMVAPAPRATNTGSQKLRDDDFEKFYHVYRKTCPVHYNEMETLRNFFNIVVAQLRAGA